MVSMMGTCPFCLSPTMEGDSICYSCGRVISGAAGMDSREKGEFQRSSSRGAKRGMAPRQAAKPMRRRRGKKKSRIYQLAMLGLVAFVFLSPDAKQYALAQWAEIQELAADMVMPGYEYPHETEYTLVRSVSYWNNDSQTAGFIESIPLPPDVYNFERGDGFAFDDQTKSPGKIKIQEIVSIKVLIDGEIIDVDTTGVQKSRESAVTTQKNSSIWWPADRKDDTTGNYCKHGPCIKVANYIEPGTNPSETCKRTDLFTGLLVDVYCHRRVDVEIKLKATSFSWWNSITVDSRIDGKAEGINIERSGSFSEISNREQGFRSSTFGASKTWYNRASTGSSDWAIDGTNNAPYVIKAATEIDASLPASMKDNVYAYARAAFDYMADPSADSFVRYPNAQELYQMSVESSQGKNPRSGEECLAGSLGDCDEQSNAFMSIMRVKNIPTWYVFGALTAADYGRWEGHGWAYIMMPLSDAYCNQVGISLSSCYIEAPVDVVNKKWLIQTPTAYINWVEQPDSTGDKINGYYKGSQYDNSYGGQIDREPRMYFTQGEPVITGGNWENKYSAEEFGG